MVKGQGDFLSHLSYALPPAVRFLLPRSPTNLFSNSNALVTSILSTFVTVFCFVLRTVPSTRPCHYKLDVMMQSWLVFFSYSRATSAKMETINTVSVFSSETLKYKQNIAVFQCGECGAVKLLSDIFFFLLRLHQQMLVGNHLRR